MDVTLDAEAIAALFTRSDGSYLCARWGRPVVPVVFGVAEGSLPVFKGAFEAVGQLTGHPVAEADPELGANLMAFAVRAWAELASVPGLERLIPDLGPLLQGLPELGKLLGGVPSSCDAGAVPPRACLRAGRRPAT